MKLQMQHFYCFKDIFVQIMLETLSTSVPGDREKGHFKILYMYVELCQINRI